MCKNRFVIEQSRAIKPFSYQYAVGHLGIVRVGAIFRQMNVHSAIEFGRQLPTSFQGCVAERKGACAPTMPLDNDRPLLPGNRVIP